MAPTPVFDPEVLASALDSLPGGAWGQPQPGSEPTNPGYQIAVLVNGGRRKPAAALFHEVLEAFAPVWAAWVALVPAGSFIGPHIDQGPYRERWHVPIRPAGTVNGQPVQAGVSFPIRHWEPHSVDNPTDLDRIHLVIDRDVVVQVPTMPFQRIEV
jgi:hypothetical protein